MPGVFCCGLRVVSMDGSTSDVPDSEPNDAFSPAVQPGPGRGVRAGAVAGGGGVRDREPAGRIAGPRTGDSEALARDPLETGCFGPGDAGAGGPQVPVGAGPGVPGHRGAHLVARLGVFHPQAGESPGRRHLSGGTDAAPQERRPAADRPGHRVHRAHHPRRRQGGALEAFCLVDLPGWDPREYPAWT